MILKDVHILPTDKTPEFIFSSGGIIKIKGRGLTVNRSGIRKEIMNWIDEYINNPPEITYVIIAFEYLNSFSSTMLVSLLKKLSQVYKQSKKLVILWYYEAGDEDILERGEFVLSAINIPIKFIVVDNIAGV